MSRTIALIIALCFILSCNRNSETKSCRINIAIYESYNLTELSESFVDANKFVRNYIDDSIVKNKTGLILLDEIQNEHANNEKSSANDYPLFLVLAPNTRLMKDGTNILDTSATLGMTLDTSTLRKYLKLADSAFPDDINWRITGRLASGYKSLHALKKDCKPIILMEQDIDSVLVMSIGPKYWIEIKLRKQLSKVLSSKSFTLILKSDRYEYSGSVVNFERYPNQHILIGEMRIDEFKWLKTILDSRIKYSN